ATKLESMGAEDRRKGEEERKNFAALPPPATPAPTSSLAAGECNGLAAESLAQIDAAQVVPTCRAALAVRPNDLTIAFQLGRTLSFVRSNEADMKTVRLLQEATRNGLVGAASSLGVMYEHGRGGLAKDEREAVRLYKLAADQGDARGQSFL